MPRPHRFRAVIEDAGGGGAFVSIPFDVEQAFGKKRPKVAATFDGAPYRGTLMRMGGDCHMIGILKEIRARIGKSIGDEVEVTIVEDTEPREVVVPADLQSALDDHPRAAAFFAQLAYTHRKEYVKWIEEAKRETTRRDRIAKAIAMLEAGRKERS